MAEYSVGMAQRAATGTQVRLERIDSVVARTGVSRSRLYQLQKAGEFPRSVSIGPGSVAWVSVEIDEYIASKIAQRDAQQAAR